MALRIKKKGKRNERMDRALQEIAKEQCQRLNINVPKSRYRLLKSKAIENDTTITKMILDWIDKLTS